MLAPEDNELVTNTNRGTPMGEVFRRYWMPVALSEELPGPDCEPLRVKVLGEDLIAFRDTNGDVGLVDAYCPHRGAPMFFGVASQRPTLWPRRAPWRRFRRIDTREASGVVMVQAAAGASFGWCRTSSTARRNALPKASQLNRVW